MDDIAWSNCEGVNVNSMALKITGSNRGSIELRFEVRRKEKLLLQLSVFAKMKS